MREQLLAWFEANGRDLPWRHTRDPYAILVSEVMLQQTQVERVVPRWQAWLERWPTVEALAGASTADVIVAWQGLGYNRRAVSLHRAARIVADRGWPDDLTELPGVGPYTAAAVGNFAFGRDTLPLDTNVLRVRERTGETFDATCAQALFDLGATVCLARIPRCGACPLSAWCPSRGARYEPLRKQSMVSSSCETASLRCPTDFDGLSRKRQPRDGNLARERRLVRDEPVDAQVDELCHAPNIVDRPRHDAQPDRLRGDAEVAGDHIVARPERVRDGGDPHRLIEQERRLDRRAESRDLGEHRFRERAHRDACQVRPQGSNELARRLRQPRFRESTPALARGPAGVSPRVSRLGKPTCDWHRGCGGSHG